MKNLLSLLTLLVLFTVLPACSNDDEPGDTSAVVGMWYGDDYDHFYSPVTLKFNSDGTGSAVMDHHGTLDIVQRGNFTYKVKGKTVTIKGVLSCANSAGESDTKDFNNTYEIQGKKLIVTNGTNWYTTRVKSYKR